MAAATSAQLRFLTDAAHLMRQTAPQISAYLMSRRIDLASTSPALVSGTLSTATLPQTDIQRQHVCTSCGLILIPGRDGTTLRIQSGCRTLKSTKAKKSQGERNRNRNRKRDESDAKVMEATVAAEVKTPHAPVARLGVTKVYVCGLCSRETRIVLPLPPPLSKQRKHKAVAEVRVSDESFASVPAESKSAARTPTVQPTALPLSADSARPLSTTPAKALNNANSKKRAKNRKAGLLALLDKSRATENNGMNSSFTFDDFRIK
ncbi:hypothetical protein SEPCBS57363_006717 [Sporothrix epigloea]|uniref:Uncharacterized protein n=1 Tax=Sporothrix epigloea TaxID=1892477 RepID=A0ABP0E508_9PEZI